MRAFTLFLAFIVFFPAHSQDLPFHETGGFGTDKSFGIGGAVYRVTNLDNQGEGSLRYGLELSGPRLIVFEVGGIIDLEESNLFINNGQVTVAGQTAPHPGITLIKGSLRIAADEVLFQHLSIRPGDGGYADPMGWEPDGFSVTGRYVVLDHCSVSWAIDENMSVANGGNDVTFYRCIVAEGLSNSIHAKGEHSCGSLVYFNSKNVSIIGSFYAHNYRRHPRIQDGSEVLFANNVIYNYGIYASHIGANVGAGNPDDPGVGDFIGNAYFKGEDGWDDYMVESHKGDFDKNNPPANGMAFMEDNIGLDRLTGNTLIQHDDYVTILDALQVMPEDFQPVDAYDNIEAVLKGAGARPAERSEVDARIVQSLIDGTGSVIDSQNEVGGYPQYEATSRSIDSIPSEAEDRRVWLDSISNSFGAAEDLNVSPLYAFIDAHPATSVKEVDALKWRCAPNPASDQLHISFSLEQGEDIQLYLVDILGRRFPLLHQKLDAGSHEQQIRLGDLSLPDGVYLLILSGDMHKRSERIFVGR
ncbi:MAG: T9SS type A sorting domain-containing protein [Bacteroidales bacterium]